MEIDEDNTEQRAENDLIIRINVATCQGITVDKISSHVWRDAKVQIQKLLDQNVTRAEKEQIARTLTDMCDRMETKNILETNIPQNVHVAIQLSDQQRQSPSSSICSDKFNDQLRERIVEFNRGLISLGDGIARLKNKLLALEYGRSTSANCDSIDVHACRNIHKNFRRILQRESRFLRDELFAAKETIYRLERRAPAGRAEIADHSTQLVPYHELPFQPAAYFNVEHIQPAQLWPTIPFTAYHPTVWERMYAHPEFTRQMQYFEGVVDQSTQCLPQPSNGNSYIVNHSNSSSNNNNNNNNHNHHNNAVDIIRPVPDWRTQRSRPDVGKRDEYDAKTK